MTETITLDGLKEALEESGSSSQLIAKKSISLKTNPSKTTLSRTHNDASNAMKELFIHSFAKLQDRGLHEVLHKKGTDFREEVQNNMSNITQDIEKLTTKWEVYLADMGHEINSNYSNPATVELEPKTPQEIMYLKIIETLDWFCVIQDNMWMANEQSMDSKQQVLRSVTKKIHNFVHSAKTKANVLRRIRSAKSIQELEKKDNIEATEDA
jgi:hypothetical protein